MGQLEILWSTRARRCALAVGPGGRLYVATVTAEPGRARLRVGSLDGHAEAEPGPLVVTARAILDVCLCRDEQDRLVALWNQYGPGGVKLHFAVRHAGGRWSAPTLVSTLFGSDLSPAVTRDELGRPWCVFQNNSTGRGHIFVTWFTAGRWAFPQRISDGDGCCFAPAACRFGHGVRVVWDARVDGEYGVFMREVDAEAKVSRREPQADVALSDSLLATPAIPALDAERSFVVYEQAPPGWGERNAVLRDSRGKMAAGNYLHARRDLRAALIGPKGIAPAAEEPNDALKAGRPSPSRSGPALAGDGEAGIWLLCRQIDSLEQADPTAGYVLAATCLSAGRWSPPIILPDSGALSDSPAVLARDGDGGVLAGYIQRDRADHRAHVVALPAVADPGRPKGAHYRAMDLSNFQASSAPRRAVLERRHGSPKLLWGDLHRHSNVSDCRWWLEGSPRDAYRYAMAAADLDFLAVTDHAMYLSTPDALADVHDEANAVNLPGVFTAFCACEANFGDGGGHMVVLAGGDALPIPRADSRADLFGQLDPAEVLVIPHHTGDPDHPYRWDGHDEALAPVVEVYQPYRSSFESPDAPAPPTPWRQAGNTPTADSTVLAGWRGGLKLGVVASSDHLSTGGAFAGVWAVRNTRADILDALRRRHCYAASDRIELVFWADGHFMGDGFRIDPAGGEAKVTFKVRCRGTEAIRNIELLGDGEVVHLFPGGKGKTGRSLTAQKKLPVPAGEHFYTLRVFQADRHMAWSSPIWITVG